MTRIHILLSALLVTCGFIFSGMLHAQAARPLTWLDDLTLLRDPSSLSLQEQQDSVMTIRHQVEDWLKAHPDSAITLPAAPALPWSAAQSTEQVSVLREAVENIIRENPDRPFHLGAVSVNVTSAASTLGLSTDSISQAEISSQHATTVAKALEFLPGVSIQHIASNRNEAGIMVRGFSSRGQVPLYLDGIPIYVPYDGYVDFNRFLTSDIAEVQVSRGYTSPLLGPNALGGTINLVTKEPTKKLEGDASIGTGSGNELLSALNLGSRWEKFFVQGSVDWLQRDYLPLSGDFKVLQYTKLPDITMTSHQNHSNSRDEKYSGRFGWTPKGNDEYVFSYTPPAGSTALGSPIDETPANPSDVRGMNLAFSRCQPQGTPMAGDRIELGTIMVFNLGGGPTDLFVKRKNPPSNPDFKSPLFTICDAPMFTKVCMTLIEGDPVLYGQEPIAFTATLNKDCAGSCGFVGVSQKTWTGIKEFYR
jgi:hypothetical protein